MCCGNPPAGGVNLVKSLARPAAFYGNALDGVGSSFPDAFAEQLMIALGHGLVGKPDFIPDFLDLLRG